MATPMSMDDNRKDRKPKGEQMVPIFSVLESFFSCLQRGCVIINFVFTFHGIMLGSASVYAASPKDCVLTM